MRYLTVCLLIFLLLSFATCSNMRALDEEREEESEMERQRETEEQESQELRKIEAEQEAEQEENVEGAEAVAAETGKQ